MSSNEDELGQIYENDDGNEVQGDPTPDDVSDEGGGGLNENLSQESTNPNIEYVTNFLYENNGQVYGMEVLVYVNNPNDENESFVIDRLTIVNQSEFDSWTTLISNLSDAYVPYTNQDLQNIQNIKTKKEQYNNGAITWNEYQSFVDELEWSDLKNLSSLESILKNEETSMMVNGVSTVTYPVEINATKFMGMNSDEFSKVGHTHNFAPKNHSFTGTDENYGIGSNDLYGHVKTVNNLETEDYVAGESLSAYQGKILDDKITDLSTKNTWLPVQSKGDYIKYKVNPDLRLVVCNYNRKDYTGLSSKTGKTELHKPKTIPDMYAPSSRVSTPLYRGDVVLYYNKDGSVNIYNLTKLKKINIYAQVMWHY